MNKEKCEVVKNDDIFNDFIEMYKKKKIIFEWSKNATNVLLSNVTKDERERLDKNTYKKFISSFLKSMKAKALGESIDEQYIKYVDKFFEYDKDLELDIFVKTKTLLNTLKIIDSEILTKRDNELKEIGHSLILNFELSKVDLDNENMSVELSIKDLKDFHDFLGNQIKRIESM